jgi:hypothetical protein
VDHVRNNTVRKKRTKNAEHTDMAAMARAHTGGRTPHPRRGTGYVMHSILPGDNDKFCHKLHIGRGQFTGVKGCEGYVAMDPYVEKYGW